MFSHLRASRLWRNRCFQFQKRRQLFISTHKDRFPSPRCASAIQIVRPLESIGETQPQLQPALGIVDYLRRRLGQFEMVPTRAKQPMPSVSSRKSADPAKTPPPVAPEKRPVPPVTV